MVYFISTELMHCKERRRAGECSLTCAHYYWKDVQMQCALPSITGYWMSLKALSFSLSTADIKIFIPFRRGTRSQYMLRNKRPEFSWKPSLTYSLCLGWELQRGRAWVQGEERWGKKEFRPIRNRGSFWEKRWAGIGKRDLNQTQARWLVLRPAGSWLEDRGKPADAEVFLP